MASGIMNNGATLGLAAILPNGTPVYVGLLTQLPTDSTGTGLVEASGSGYARVAVSAWLNLTDASGVSRVNNGATTFPALTAALTGIVGWGIWSASVGGNLLACGENLNSVVQAFVATDQPTLADQSYGIRSQAKV